MPKTQEEVVRLIIWDEVCGEPSQVFEDSDEMELLFDWDTPDDKLEYEIRRLMPEEDPNASDENQGWWLKKFARTPSTITTEWRSDRNHLAIITLIKQ